VERIAITVRELAEQTGQGERTVRAWTKRGDDPLPYTRIQGERYGFVLVREFEEWAVRNRDEIGPRR